MAKYLKTTILLLLLISSLYSNDRSYFGQAIIKPIEYSKDYSLLKHKVALVIGNRDYEKKGWRNLDTPIEDAKALKRILENELGFNKVIYKENLKRNEITEVLKEFYSSIHKDGMGLIYFAGHGVSLNNKNYYIPVDVGCIDEYNLNDTISLDGNFIRKKDDRPKLLIVIVDACRDVPQKGCTLKRGGKRGNSTKQEFKDASGLLIHYSTQDGADADDNNYKNITKNHSIYTYYLLQNLKKAYELTNILKETSKDVKEKTNDKQIPVLNSQEFIGKYFFKAPIGSIVFYSNRDGDININDTQKISYKKLTYLNIDVELGNHEIVFKANNGFSKKESVNLSLSNRTEKVFMFDEGGEASKSDFQTSIKEKEPEKITKSKQTNNFITYIDKPRECKRNYKKIIYNNEKLQIINSFSGSNEYDWMVDSVKIEFYNPNVFKKIPKINKPSNFKPRGYESIVTILGEEKLSFINNVKNIKTNGFLAQIVYYTNLIYAPKNDYVKLPNHKWLVNQRVMSYKNDYNPNFEKGTSVKFQDCLNIYYRYCGDGILDKEHEECDEGGNNGNGKCSKECSLVIN